MRTTVLNLGWGIILKQAGDELSSHQAETVSLNLASSYGYITSITNFL